MKHFHDIMEITKSGVPELSDEFKKLINKELALGMTDFVCEHGTLSEGFDKITDSQKYYQAVKESYVRKCELVRIKCSAKKAYADFLDATEKLKTAKNDAEALRFQAELELAELGVFELNVQAADTERQLKAFERIKAKLGPDVKATYPDGIESAELDNWRVVAEFKALKQSSTGKLEDLTVIPLPLDEKAKLGMQLAHGEMAIAEVLRNKKTIEIAFGGDTKKFLDSKAGVIIK